MAVARIRGRRWMRIRQQYRDQNPWCVDCLEDGNYVPWTELDHDVALINGGTNDPSNLLGRCDDHHKIKTRLDRGFKPGGGCDIQGQPTDPNHPWNLNTQERKAHEN